MKRHVWLVAILVAQLAWAQRNPELERAQTLIAQKKYAPALKSLEAAAKRGGLDHASLLSMLESRGVAQAALGQTGLAEDSFRLVLQLDAGYDLSGKYVGKVATVINAARAWVKEHGGIQVGVLEPGVANGRLTQLSVFVRNDPLNLVSSLRVHVRADGGAWKPVEQAVVNGVATIDVDAESAELWIEALSDKRDQLLFVGSAGRPLKQQAPAPPPPAAKVEAPVPAAEPAPVVVPVAVKTQAAPSSGSFLRPVSYVLLGLGLASAGVGTYFGVTANGMREGIKADLDRGGVDQGALYARDQNAIMNSILANAFFIGAGVLGVTGVVTWLLGRDVAVAVVPQGSGVAVVGRF